MYIRLTEWQLLSKGGKVFLLTPSHLRALMLYLEYLYFISICLVRVVVSIKKKLLSLVKNVSSIVYS